MCLKGGGNSVEDAYNYIYKQLMIELNRLKGDFPLTIVYSIVYSKE